MEEIKDRIVCFFQEDNPHWCFSNWYPCRFIYAGVEYNSMEQYMMYQKAIIFNDEEAALKVLSLDSPKLQKAIGRELEDRPIPLLSGDKTSYLELWNKNKYFIVKQGLRAKLLQNKDILNELLATQNKVIVECSATDKVWGAGRSIDDPSLYHSISQADIDSNYLGKILMELRDEFGKKIRENKKLEYEDYSNFIKNSPIPLMNQYPFELYLNPIYHNAISAFCDKFTSINARAAFLKNDPFKVYAFGPEPGYKEMIQAVYELYYSSI